MPLGREAVEKVFLLARISPGPYEIETFAAQLDAVLEYMDTLNRVDTTAVDPVGSIAGLSNVFRDDVVHASLPVGDVLANAPSEDGEAFTVPKVF